MKNIAMSAAVRQEPISGCISNRREQNSGKCIAWSSYVWINQIHEGSDRSATGKNIFLAPTNNDPVYGRPISAMTLDKFYKQMLLEFFTYVPLLLQMTW